MENSYKYFENRECKFFPCHKGLEDHNCLFCFCPLYNMEDCKGDYKYVKGKDGITVKDCTNCSFPHHHENYEMLMKMLMKK